MMRKSHFILTITIILMTALATGCTTPPKASEDTTRLNKQLLDLTSENESLMHEVAALREALQTEQQQNASSLIDTALNAVSFLRAKDMQLLSSVIHPVVGVRISPYAHVDIENDLHFAAQDIQTLLANSQILTWGAYDGTGFPIALNASDYFDRFIYDSDYLSPHMIGINTLIGTGNTLINIQDIYPNASFVEFHFTGLDPQYSGIDWRSLILVFEELNGEWYLTGIVHNEWTI